MLSMADFKVKFQNDNESFDADFQNVQTITVGENAGQNGATFYPSVSADGVLSWTNDRGLPNPAPVNIKGNAPVRGVDYYTQEDVEYIINAVLAALGGGSGGETDDYNTAELDKAILDTMILE